MRFRACLRRHVFHPELNADLLKKVVGRDASGKVPDIIVGKLLLLSLNVEDDAFRFEFDRTRVKPDFDLPRTDAIFHTCAVAFLDAAELV